jgi:hypothetical protein
MVTWPLRIVEKPQIRSQLRALTLCGIAEEPTWPS